MDKLLFAYSYVTGAITAPRRDEKGATAVEYGLLVVLIAAVIVGIVATLGTRIGTGFQTVVNALP
ncbi:Flp family type IVb pilin [Aeromicrobium sp. CTD01-1L150]|uniref:Flp family type IVb pilin n=1 Tax=Aeromicrobium sp. CTD01-1L150 TaxID=3341830 RepID=UPI0035C05CEB